VAVDPPAADVVADPGMTRQEWIRMRHGKSFRSPLPLRDGDRERLTSMTRCSSVRAGLAQRARIVLLAADGMSNTAIAQRMGVSRPTVIG
jgi:DNA-binding NarL/FixJ family response regulator